MKLLEGHMSSVAAIQKFEDVVKVEVVEIKSVLDCFADIANGWRGSITLQLLDNQFVFIGGTRKGNESSITYCVEFSKPVSGEVLSAGILEESQSPLFLSASCALSSRWGTTAHVLYGEYQLEGKHYAFAESLVLLSDRQVLVVVETNPTPEVEEATNQVVTALIKHAPFN